METDGLLAQVSHMDPTLCSEFPFDGVKEKPGPSGPAHQTSVRHSRSRSERLAVRSETDSLPYSSLGSRHKPDTALGDFWRGLGWR